MKFIDLINEDEERHIKKVKAVFKALGRRLYRRVDDHSYYFQLPDHFKVLNNDFVYKELTSIGNYGYDIIYVQVGHDGDVNSVKFYYKKDGEDEMVKMDSSSDQYGFRLLSVNEKLKPFNIRVIYKRRNGEWE